VAVVAVVGFAAEAATLKPAAFSCVVITKEAGVPRVTEQSSKMRKSGTHENRRRERKNPEKAREEWRREVLDQLLLQGRRSLRSGSERFEKVHPGGTPWSQAGHGWAKQREQVSQLGHGEQLCNRIAVAVLVVLVVIVMIVVVVLIGTRSHQVQAEAGFERTPLKAALHRVAQLGISAQHAKVVVDGDKDVQ